MAASGKNPKKRNARAGTKKGTSKSARRLQASPKARAKKKAYATEYHKSAKRKKYRAKLNKANRDNPNKKGEDKSHTKKGKLVNEKQTKNRGRNGKGKKSSKK